MSDTIFDKAIQFINFESDLLDQGEFYTWLTLWNKEGLYIIPIDHQTNDFSNNLNYAYDNEEMRKKRVSRLYSGESISTTPRARTVRMSGRHRLLNVDENRIELRCAQSLWEFRKGNRQHHVADITYHLEINNGEFLIDKKIIKIINSDDYLSSVGYIL
jgi:3-phenylpropionate/cinnamic acid dioxygenase small subunit